MPVKISTKCCDNADCGVCGRRTGRGAWFESGQRNPFTGETPFNNFICDGCQKERRMYSDCSMNRESENNEGKEMVSGEAADFTYVPLFEAGQHALKTAKKEPRQRMHFCLLSLVASAFCMEAYFNELGERQLKLWSQPEKKSSLEKLGLICARLGLSPDFQMRPFSSFIWVRKFRDSVAHGRTEVIAFKDAVVSNEQPFPEHQQPTIEQQCTLEIASDVAEDARKIIETLGSAAGSLVSPLLIRTSTTWTSIPN
jgi:hypothetical protein